MHCCVCTARMVTQTSQNVTRYYTTYLVKKLKSSILVSYRHTKGVITIGVTWGVGGIRTWAVIYEAVNLETKE